MEAEAASKAIREDLEEGAMEGVSSLNLMLKCGNELHNDFA